MRYEICVQGYLDLDWAEWFEGFTLTHRPDHVTILVGPVADQAGLRGLLNKICDLGLILTSIHLIEKIDEAQ